MATTPSSPEAAVRRHPRRIRLFLFPLFLLALFEGASFAGLWWLMGERPRAEAIRAAQEEVAGARAPNLPASAGAPGRRRPGLKVEAIHPYLGYLPIERSVHQLHDGVGLNTEAFYADGSPAFSRDETLLVIGITGGSVAVFFARKGRQRLTEQLARHPRYVGRAFRFVVLAFGGHKQPQQLMALNYLLVQGGRLDVLINIDGYNEVALHDSQNEAQGVAPLFPRDWLLRTGADPVSVPALAELAWLARRRSDAADRAAESPLRRSWTWRLAWKLRDRAFLAGMRRAEADFRAQSNSQDPSRVGNRRPGAPLDQLVGAWREGSRQLDKLCRANDIEYFHFLQPNQYVENTKVLSREELETACAPRNPKPREVPAGYARLIPGCAELASDGVRCHDLTGVFADVEATVYIDTCCHLNRLGNELMADAIAAAMLSYAE